MSDDLPIGWDRCNLGTVVSVKNGYAFKSSDYSTEGIPLVRISDIQEGKVNLKNSVFIPKEKANIDFTVQNGDLLIAMSGATTGKVGIYTGKEICLQNQRVGNFKILSHQLLNTRFRDFYVLSLSKNIEDAAYGGAQPNISSSVLESLEISLPPLNEQRRIVDKLERIGDRHRTARNELNHIPKLIARYKQAVLATACSGKLTEDWRIKQNLENSWQSTTLSEVIIDKPKNGYSAKPVQYETPFRVLTLTATTSGKFNSEHFKYFDEYIAEDSQFWLQPNDILIQRGNTIEYVGVPAIYDGLPNQYIFPDLMMRLRARENVITQFLYFVLSCENSRQYLRDRATGTAGSMPKINQPTLISLPIELPSIEEQKEIVWRVEKMFEKIDRMEQEYQKAAKLCDRLEQATLAKAFRGELVPQDPDDEPASVLLEQGKMENGKWKMENQI